MLQQTGAANRWVVCHASGIDLHERYMGQPPQLNAGVRLRSMSLSRLMSHLRRLSVCALFASAISIATACIAPIGSRGEAPPVAAAECPALAAQARQGEPGAVDDAVHSWLCAPEAVEAAAAGLRVLAAREPVEGFHARLRRLPLAPDSAIVATLLALADDPTLPELTRALAGERLERAIQGWTSPTTHVYATTGPGEPEDCSGASGMVRAHFDHGSVSRAWRRPSAELAARWRRLQTEWRAEHRAAIARRRVAHGCLAEGSAP